MDASTADQLRFRVARMLAERNASTSSSASRPAPGSGQRVAAGSDALQAELFNAYLHAMRAAPGTRCSGASRRGPTTSS